MPKGVFFSQTTTFMSVKVLMLSDFDRDPAPAVTLEKNTADPPQKVIIDYWDTVRKDGGNVADVISRPVVSATRASTSTRPGASHKPSI
jgi:hypothetical protein